MSGCTDMAFRLISREHKAGFCFFEMIDANALYRGHKDTIRRLKTHRKDTPIAAQLLGEKPHVLLDAAKKLIDLTDIAFLDINAACPVRKVTRKGCGSALLREPQKLFEIIETLAINLPCPVTVKLRTGYEKSSPKESQIIAKNCQEAGAKALFVHGRTRAQGYAGDIDYDAIKAIKESVKIPVFGSGNILNPVLAKRMFDETECDGILVARGALGNPWIFQDIEEYLKTGQIAPKRPLPLKKKTLKRHLYYLEKYKVLRPKGRLGFMRKVAIWYLKGVPEACKVRDSIVRARSYKELIRVINGVIKEAPSPKMPSS
ncbi:MAG: tRNA dihydrouridine synthase DusB [Candidatus Omnitrophica bacterium]|nr:tRNA dihydrouridine synthase DusB [Candidatus Omnitrophota bacterium]